MEKKCIKFPKIGQFRNMIADINRIVSYRGLDENGEAILDLTATKPVIVAKGSVKLHGTNAGVQYSNKNGVLAQSRENIITIEKDNAGFAFFVESNKTWFENALKTIALENNIDLDEHAITMYGEWAGKGIQKGVAIAEIDKSMFIFGIKVSKPGDEDFNAYWLDYTGISNSDIRVFNIKDFPTYEVEIDFNMPGYAQNELERLTMEVENECPVAKAFGHSGIGEGLVWTVEYNGITHRFKTKGAKHSNSKTKTIAKVDTEKLDSIKEFIDYAVTNERFDQAIERVFTNNGEEPNIKKMGDVIRYVVNDIASEEMDTMKDNGLEPKDVNKYISNEVRNRFIKFLDEKAGI